MSNALADHARFCSLIMTLILKVDLYLQPNREATKLRSISRQPSRSPLANRLIVEDVWQIFSVHAYIKRRKFFFFRNMTLFIFTSHCYTAYSPLCREFNRISNIFYYVRDCVLFRYTIHSFITTIDYFILTLRYVTFITFIRQNFSCLLLINSSSVFRFHLFHVCLVSTSRDRLFSLLTLFLLQRNISGQKNKNFSFFFSFSTSAKTQQIIMNSRNNVRKTF